MTMLTVVNENDQVIGKKAGAELLPTDIYRVARLLIVNSKGQLLLAQRARTKQKDPGLWGLAVEGTVESRETYESNIRKEAQEEIGITLGKLELGPRLRMSGKYNHHCQFFVYRADLDIQNLTLQEEELAVVQWFDVDALRHDVAAHPEIFGYNFALIAEKAFPYMHSASPTI
ncbi:MAG TPA: NUDIX domain-containing protein [Nevskiaceae bacterium]|nr:NUDIX domain-containing protein [Nevskiaceae bacterium]